MIILFYLLFGFTFIIGITSLIYRLFAFYFLYKDADERKESPLIWLVLALFFDTIIFLIYYFLFRKKEYPLGEQGEIASQKYFKFLKYYLIFTVISVIILIISLIPLISLGIFASILGI